MKKYRPANFHMVLNLPQEHICYLLNTMGMRVQSGETFHDGDMISGIYEDRGIRLKKVRETGQDVLRIIIPDKHIRFPENENCMEPYRHQKLEMFENQEMHYLKKAVWKTAVFSSIQAVTGYLFYIRVLFAIHKTIQIATDKTAESCYNLRKRDMLFMANKTNTI